LGYGGEVGLLMDCVIGISGEEGFNKLLDTMVAAEDPVKLKILVLQISIRNERPKYDPILKLKLKHLKSPRLKKVIEDHLAAASAEKEPATYYMPKNFPSIK
jgi:hypothetical protein